MSDGGLLRDWQQQAVAQRDARRPAVRSGAAVPRKLGSSATVIACEPQCHVRTAWLTTADGSGVRGSWCAAALAALLHCGCMLCAASLRVAHCTYGVTVPLQRVGLRPIRLVRPPLCAAERQCTPREWDPPVGLLFTAARHQGGQACDRRSLPQLHAHANGSRPTPGNLEYP